MIPLNIKFTLKFKITFMVILILILVLLVVGFVVIEHVQEEMMEQLKKDAMNIAQTITMSPTIANNIGLEGGMNVIQPIANDIMENTKTDFVVVMGMDGIGYSHPLRERLGMHFVGGDELKVLKEGKSYVSQATGSMGPSIRAFAPIYRNARQVGAVAVGILLEDVNKKINSIINYIYLTFFIGAIIGIIGSVLLANNVKKSIFGLEPEEIAKLLQEKSVIINSIKEGIIAIDAEHKITLINKEAKNILNYKKDIIDKKIEEIVPTTQLPRLLKTGKPEYNKEQIINDTNILTNRVPIKINDNVVGVVASFNKKTDVQKLAEELTGVRKFANALRSQNHEFMNKLHTISGLIQLKEYDDAINIISHITHQKQELTSFLIKKIHSNEIAGLLLGKFDEANELNINLKIDPKTSLSNLASTDFKERLVTIIGNLIDNAIESHDKYKRKSEKKEIYLNIFEDEYLLKIIVRDNGTGIPESIQTRIFNRGFTTKKNKAHGIGLDIVKNNVDLLGGDIEFESIPGKGTEFIITIPY